MIPFSALKLPTVAVPLDQHVLSKTLRVNVISGGFGNTAQLPAISIPAGDVFRQIVRHWGLA